MIDCVCLREEMERLNCLFEDENILKVTLDVTEKMSWLWRDFKIRRVMNSIDLSLFLKELNLTSAISYLSSTLLDFSF